MKHEHISGSSEVDEFIYLCFDHIRPADKRKFLNSFRHQSSQPDQMKHVFRELILGAYLCSAGLNARHDCAIDDKTPDWCIFDDECNLLGIVELMSFHVDRTTEDKIQANLRFGKAPAIWRDANKNNVCRLYQRIEGKVQKYSGLVNQLDIAYAIAVFSDFLAAIDVEDDLNSCLFGQESGLFGLYPKVSGVLHFEEHGGSYQFRYVRNPRAFRTLDFSDGWFGSHHCD